MSISYLVLYTYFVVQPDTDIIFHIVGIKRKQTQQSFIIQPELESKLSTTYKLLYIGERDNNFMKRRNSGWNKNPQSCVELSEATYDNRMKPPTSIRVVGQFYPKVVHEANDSVFLSPRVNDCLSKKLHPRRNSSFPKCMQSTQDLPRMHLFNDIMTKVVKNKKLSFMKTFMINLYKEAYPQLDTYISNYNPMVGSRQGLYESISRPPHQEKYGNPLSDRQNSTKSTGRFRGRTDGVDYNPHNEDMLIQEVNRDPYEGMNQVHFNSQDTLSFRDGNNPPSGYHSKNQSSSNFFSNPDGREVQSKLFTV